MATINIRRVTSPCYSPLRFEDFARLTLSQDVTDPFYRYKMERLQAKIEGKGNGIKTVVVNLNGVSQSLSRPPACTYPTILPHY
jgi:hypothetical protein